MKDRVTVLAEAQPDDGCLKRTIAHEAAHAVYHTLPAQAFGGAYADYLNQKVDVGNLHRARLKDPKNTDKANHSWIREIEKCIRCP